MENKGEMMWLQQSLTYSRRSLRETNRKHEYIGFELGRGHIGLSFDKAFMTYMHSNLVGKSGTSANLRQALKSEVYVM